ncbi:MAG TPA: hypothetical protein PLJ60_16030 [Chryseolinea sp.]|nr:hypothetical protein [Chryseolinea sp.]HPM31844.1 hypothetical protein [Chryseolinea sp.]
MKHFLLLLTILTFQLQILVAAPFIKGYYYSNDGKKIEGLIKFNRATFSVFGSKPSNIKFKTNSESKAIKLTAEDISSFVIDKDSFAAVHNIKINSIAGEYTKDFAQVIETGAIKLFLHKSASSDGKYSYENDIYVISRDNKYFGIWNFNKQRDEIAAYFSERPDLREKILDKKDKTTIRELVRDFNQSGIR